MVIIDIRPSTDPPEAKFNANIVIALPGTSVTFKDNTKGLPTSWNWQFPGATPDNSNSQHPSGIVYNTPGFYDVCLIAANSYGSDTMNQKTYIYIVDTSNNFITGTMPLKNSIGVERDSNIRIQFKQAMEPSSFSNTSIRIFGDLRGSYSFQSTYNSATNTLVINPDNLFMTGENIVIVLTEKIHTSQNDSIVPYSFTFQVTSGHGTGIFKQVAYFPISCNEWPGSLKCGDYDNDGDIDIATSRGDLLLNDGSGNFSITSHGLWGYAIANGDFDMNHMVDIFNGSTIALNEGGGLFAYQGVGTWGTNLNTSDLNNDGLMDIIGSLPWPYVQNGSVLTTKRNIGNVNFIEYSSHTTSDIINSTALGDIDNDGDFDICAAGGSVFINTLDTLNMMTSLKFSGSIIKSGDFNNDGN
ncbi:MAG: FG-GAP-like repeat-containing protein, partial [Bacteroidota bacterium]